MEAQAKLICSICGKRGLIDTFVTNIKQNRIICENEHIIHFKFGEVEFLTKTEQAIHEEIEEELLKMEPVLN